MARQIILIAITAVICRTSAAPEPAVTILGQESPNAAFAPQDPSRTPRILRFESDSTPEGTFSYTYETENGISARVEGTVTKGADPDQNIQSIKGQYSYTGPDGVLYTVQYIANENGFQAFGDHLPTPPPIPDAIHRSLDHNAAHPEEDNSIVAASPALAPTSIFNPAPKPTFDPALASPIPTTLPDPFPTKLPPRVVTTNRSVPPTTLNRFSTLATSTPVPPTRSPTLPTLPKQTQQLAQAQLLAQTQLLQQQQLQQQLQQQIQQQQLQAQQLQPQQFQFQSLQPQQFQPQQLSSQLLQPQQFQQLQPQSLQPQQFTPQQLQPQSLQAQQLTPQQFTPQQFTPQQFTPQQLQPQQLQPQQLQSQQFQFPQFQSQGVPNQFMPTFQSFPSQRRNFQTS